MENGHIESFNGKLRDKLLNQELPHAATGAGAAPTGGADRQSRPAALLAGLQAAGRRLSSCRLRLSKCWRD